MQLIIFTKSSLKLCLNVSACFVRRCLCVCVTIIANISFDSVISCKVYSIPESKYKISMNECMNQTSFLSELKLKHQSVSNLLYLCTVKMGFIAVVPAHRSAFAED